MNNFDRELNFSLIEINEGIKLGIKAMKLFLEKEFSLERMEVGIVEKENKKFVLMGKNDLKKIGF